VLATLNLPERPDEEVLNGLYQQALTSLMQDADCEADCSALDYLDVGTLQLLLALNVALQARKKELRLTGVSDALRQWLGISGAAHHLPLRSESAA